MTGNVEGYAVVEDGVIDIRTVSPREVAAMVNWLCVSRNVLLSNLASDDTVRALWERERGRGKSAAMICRVTVSCEASE